MTTLTMTSWTKGLQTVSLIEAVNQHSTGSLMQAKAAVDRLLAGERVVLEFTSESMREEFRVKAEVFGAIFE